MRPNVAPYQIVRRSRSRMRRWIPSRDEVASIAKTIPGAPHGLDQLDGVLIVDFATEPPHQHPNRREFALHRKCERDTLKSVRYSAAAGTLIGRVPKGVTYVSRSWRSKE